MTPSRHHPALVALHWLLALLLIVALVMGTVGLKTLPNVDPGKIDALRGHMIAGTLILLLTLVRWVVRRRTAHPPPVATGHPLADRLAPAMHLALYALVVAMAASGIGMALSTGLPGVVFGGVGTLPATFEGLAPRAVHGVVAKLLMLAIAVHVGAALWHQFVRRDRLLARMGFGAR